MTQNALAQVHIQAQIGKAPASGTMQRKCDKCCKKKKPTLQRSMVSSAPEAIPTVPEEQRSPVETDATAPGSIEPHFFHDFSQIPVHSRPQGRIRAKLAVNAPGDVYEQEADRVADQVLAVSSHLSIGGASLGIQRLSGQPASQADAAPTSVNRVLASPGRPLELALRKDMEHRFGHDFSGVRVHTDAAAEQSARDVSADAYTVGHNIAFGRGQFTPGNYAGRRLISHELAHVVQQSGVEGIHLDQIDENHDLLPISLTIQRKQCASDFPCLRLPFPPGSVRFQGCTNDQLKDYAIIPEDGTETVTPTNDEEFDCDGFFFRHHQPPTQWFKIPSHCDTTITCEGNDFSCLKCCNLAASIFKGSPRWTSDLHDAANPFDQSTSAQ